MTVQRKVEEERESRYNKYSSSQKKKMVCKNCQICVNKDFQDKVTQYSILLNTNKLKESPFQNIFLLDSKK